MFLPITTLVLSCDARLHPPFEATEPLPVSMGSVERKEARHVPVPACLVTGTSTTWSYEWTSPEGMRRTVSKEDGRVACVRVVTPVFGGP